MHAPMLHRCSSIPTPQPVPPVPPLDMPPGPAWTPVPPVEEPPAAPHDAPVQDPPPYTQ